MKKIAALGIASLVAAASLAVTASSASADPPHRWIHHYDYHHYNYHPQRGWGWGGPFFLGLGLGTVYGNSYGYDYGYGWDDHVRWCEAHYRTYSPATDTFYIRPGVPVRCVAPFDRY